MTSRMICRAFCTILSLGGAIVNGLFLFVLGLGISTLLDGLKSKIPFFSSLATFSNHAKFIPSSVVLPTPLVVFPGLPLISS